MKTRHVFLTALLLSLTVAVPAFADTDSSIGAEGGLRAQLEIKKVELEHERESVKNTIKLNIESLRSSSTEARKELNDDRREFNKDVKDLRKDFRIDVARMHLMNAGKLFSLTIDRLNRIINRLDSRIEKIKAAGGSTTEAEGFITTAKTSIADAKLQVTAINSIDFSTVSSTTAQTMFDTVKTEVAKARTDLESARQNLLKAVRSLATVEASVRANASTTVSH